MSRLDEIKARAEQVHWTSTPIEQATARMASSAADVPWLLSTVECLTDLCGEFRKREERLNAEVERLRGWIDRSERQEARARRAEAEVARLTAERDALAAQVARVESLAEEWEREAEDLLRNCYSGRDVFEAERTVQIVSELRAALAGSEADTSDTQSTGQECIKVAPDPGHEDEGYSCVTHNCAWDECLGSHYLTTRKPECRCQIIAPARRERGSGVLIEPPEWEQADDCPVHPTTRAGEPA